MHGFTEVGFGKERYPKEAGAYNCVIITRDGHPIIRVLHFDNSVEYSERWIRMECSEYGYLEHSTVDANFVRYFKKIEGVELQIVPEIVTLKVDGVDLDE